MSVPLLISLNLTAFGQSTQILQHGLFLSVGSLGRGSDAMIGTADPVIGKIVRGESIHAKDGSKVVFGGERSETWTEHSADSAGWFKGNYLHSGYALFNVKSDGDRVGIIEAMGNDLVYVNGIPRGGNKYGYKDNWDPWEPAFNYSQIPVELRKGDNQLLFVCSRGLLKVTFRRIAPAVLFNTKDVTLPDLLVGQSTNDWAGVTVVNATDKPLVGAYIKVSSESGLSSETRVPLIQPFSIRKVGFKLVGPAPTSVGETAVNLKLMKGRDVASEEIANAQISLKIVEATATHNITFISTIDSSVQYYALVPPRGPDNGKPKALFFSLHGADVIATNMANSYYPKTWGYIVCPTNGGPYGFDWEDWGRLDALQVLHIVKSTLNIDPGRIYLTGHSMGGHGTWVIGSQYPDQFAAIGASSGWINWWSYVFHHDAAESPMAKILRRSMNPVDPYKLDQNFKQYGVYVLHGSEDDNVPVTEALGMVDTLSKFDKDFVFHEQMGVGHWWGLNDQAGTDCVDWPPMFDFFAKHARPGEERIQNIDFTTANPGVSARDYWLTIYSQEKQLEPSRAVVRFIPSRNRFVGTTENVKVISFNLKYADKSKPFEVDLDSTNLKSVSVSAGDDDLWLTRESGKWQVTSEPSPNDKGPVRYGTFKDAFRHDVIFVYGTHGTKEENEWAFDKARFDAEYFWYQRGGSIDVVSDREFNPEANPDRSVILYGNEKTNSAWSEVLSDSPVRVSEGKLTFGEKVMKGKDLTCFMVRPRKGSAIASVGIVSGTGIEGMRMTYVVPYLQPWFSLPDLTILSASIFSKDRNGISRSGFSGEKNGGQIGFGSGSEVKVAGFFGLDWSVNNGEFVEEK